MSGGSLVISHRSICIGLLLLTIFLPACASFQGGELKRLQSLPEVENKPSAKALLGFKIKINNRTRSSEKAKNKMYKRMVRTFRETNVFSEVGKFVEKPDLTVDVSLVNTGSFSQFGAFLTGATLTLIPTKATDRYVLDATITNEEGRKWIIHLEDHINSWIHLTLLPVTPFKSPGSVSRTVQRNMFRHLVKEMLEKGIISETKKMTIKFE